MGGTGRGREGQAKVKRERTGIVVMQAKGRHENTCMHVTPAHRGAVESYERREGTEERSGQEETVQQREGREGRERAE